MKTHRRTVAEMWADPFALTPEELGMTDPDAESASLELEQLDRMSEGMREAVTFNRRAAA